MKHIYISQGKKYISSKRASKISDYSSDYVGQLCRTKKLDCKMVGHTWFVTEESLREHMASVVSYESLQNRIQNIRKDKKSQFGGKDPKTFNEPERISTKHASLMSGYNTDYLGQLCRSGRLDCRMVGSTWFITKESLRQHIDSVVKEKKAKSQKEQVAESPFPSLVVTQQSVEVSKSKDGFGHQPEYADDNEKPHNILLLGQGNVLSEETKSQVAQSETSYPKFKRSIMLRKALVGTLVVLVFVSAVSITFKPANNVSTMTSGAPVTASVYNIFEAVFSFFHNGYRSAIALFQRGEKLSMNTSETALDNYQNIPYNGLAVVPSTGSVVKDEQMKKDIRNSFSDQIEITPDSSGTAGVITPVFRQAKGKDFIYVMVPVVNQVGGSSVSTGK